jgi:hypothetical protein
MPPRKGKALFTLGRKAEAIDAIKAARRMSKECVID